MDKAVYLSRLCRRFNLSILRCGSSGSLCRLLFSHTDGSETKPLFLYMIYSDFDAVDSSLSLKQSCDGAVSLNIATDFSASPERLLAAAVLYSGLKEFDFSMFDLSERDYLEILCFAVDITVSDYYHAMVFRSESIRPDVPVPPLR